MSLSVNRKWLRYAALGAGVVAGLELIRREWARRRTEEEEEFTFTKMQALCATTHSTPLVMAEADVPKVVIPFTIPDVENTGHADSSSQPRTEDISARMLRVIHLAFFCRLGTV